MLKLSMLREPSSDQSYFARKSYEATLFVDHNGPPYDQRWLGLSFATNPAGKNVSLFRMAIYPEHFAELARMMIEADPVVAVRAFGAAMQSADLERGKPPATEEEKAA